MQRFEIHSHTHYSNFRLLDCINRPKDLVKRANELGLCGIAITDHETLAGHMELNLFKRKKLKKKIQILKLHLVMKFIFVEIEPWSEILSLYSYC